MNQVRSEALDAVRGIAIILVVGHHYLPGLLPAGGLGVDLFFVLSGYLIGGMLLDNKGAPNFFVTFYARRAFRILPLYWLFLLLFPVTGLLWYITFSQSLLWANTGAFPQREAIAVTWSLAIEEQFYVILPPLIAFLPRPWLVRALWACVLAAPLWRWGLSGITPLAWLMLPSRLDALMGGALIACFMRGHADSRVQWALLALTPSVTDVALHRLAPDWHMAPYSFMALLCAAGLLCIVQQPPGRIIILRPLSWLGIGAYSMYLFHLPIVSLTGSPMIALPLLAALAWASWRYLEAPLTRFARKQWRYDTGTVPPIGVAIRGPGNA
jgi:peptidoglycan/LPS O-acetylase OafA/YrhL